MISDSNEQRQQELEYTLLKPDCQSWWISKMQSDTLEERYAITFCFKLGSSDNWGDERGCDEGNWRAHTRGLPSGLPEVVGTVQQVHCNRRRLLRRGLEFHVRTIDCLITTASEQGLDYREGDELSWCPSWSNSLWQGWSCGLVYCPGGNATDPIWRVLASSQGISCWTPLKPQHINPNPNPLANQLWCNDFFTPPTAFIITHRLPTILESLIPLKNWCSIHARWSKSSLKHSIHFCDIFSKFIYMC